MWLSTFDFLIIVAVLLITLSIGIYFGCAGGGPQTTDEFLQAGRNMGILPVSLSLMATYISTATLMGIPAEIYMFGTPMGFLIVGIILGMLTATYVFLPVYFSAQVSTSYEYVEKRFGSISRTICSLGYVIQAIFFTSVILHTSALALSAGSDRPTSDPVSVLVIGGICTIYCTLGGMKAVLWTDVFQSLLMFVCLFSIVTKGIVDIGFSEIFRICEEGGRLIIPSFSANISLKYTGWSVIIMGFTMSTFTYGTSQLQVQRLLTVKSCRKSQLSVLASIPFTATFYLLCCFCGLVFYATYWNCDPLSEKKVSFGDQIMPYYIIKNLDRYPGLPGLCLCGILAASLSTVSSSIHTLTAVTIKDFLQPFFRNCGFSPRNSALPKALTLGYGITGVWLSFVVARWGNIIKATILLFNLSGGPLLGLFFLGVLTTRANEKGVIIGIVTSFAMSVWLSFGPFTSIHKDLNFSTEGCPVYGLLPTESPLNTTLSLEDNLNEDKFLMSFMWVTPIAMVSCVVIGYVFSVIINFYTGEEKHIPPEYSTPILLWFDRMMFQDAQSTDKAIVMENLHNQTAL